MNQFNARIPAVPLNAALAPAPANAPTDIVGIDPTTGWQVTDCGHYDTASVPAKITVVKSASFAKYCQRLSSCLIGRDGTGWTSEAQNLVAQQLVFDYCGHIYCEDLAVANHFKNVLAEQRIAHTNGSKQPGADRDDMEQARRQLLNIARMSRKTAYVASRKAQAPVAA